MRKKIKKKYKEGLFLSEINNDLLWV
jgi:hypothetical protein